MVAGLSTLGKTLFKFVIDSQVFPSEAHVIEDLAYDVIIGRDFLQKFSFKIDFENGIVNFSPEDPLPFGSVQLNDSFDDSAGPGETFITSVHASRTYIIPPQSENLVSGKLNSLPSEVGINSMVAPMSDLSHRYSVFGASELVRVAEDGTIPVRMLNPSSQPVKIYLRTRLANFEEVDQNIATFELNATEQVGEPPSPESTYCQVEQNDYSELPDLLDSPISDVDRIKFQNFLRNIAMCSLFLMISWVEHLYSNMLLKQEMLLQLSKGLTVPRLKPNEKLIVK